MTHPSSLDTRPRSSADYSERFVVSLAVAWALAWITWTWLSWYRYHPHLPWRDLFLVLSQVREISATGFDPATFWQWFEPHYGTHRIAIPRLLVLLDNRLLSGQNHMLYGAAWCCLILLPALYARLASRHFATSRAVLFMFALACIWLFSPAHLWNLVNPINVSWHLSLTTALLAVYLLLGSGHRPHFWQWLGAYLLCAVSAFSTFAGVIAWLMLPVIALLIQPRAIIPSLFASAACAWLYAGGMSSDAALASSWDMGSEVVIAEIRAQAQAALAGNTPLKIAQRTLQFLTWPLTPQAPQLALALGFGSLVVVTLFFISALISATRAHEQLPPLLSFCLIVAGLCIGIALATQLGRLMVHPNHAHGPSYERYQTVVVIYWMSVSGLLLSQATLRGFSTTILYVLMLVMAWVLQLPTGTYLREEILSAEAAAELFNRGQLAHAAGLQPVPGNRFSPNFVYSFDDFFYRHRLAYRAPGAIPAQQFRLEPCPTETMKLNFGIAKTYAEYQDLSQPRAVSAVITTPRSQLLRAIVLYQQGKVVGRLSPVHVGGFTPYALLQPEFTRWRGIIAAHLDTELTLQPRGPAGVSAACSYRLQDAT